MSDKEAVLELLNRLPAETSMQQILQEIQFVVAVKQGLDEIDRGEGISVESVEQVLRPRTMP
jgi:DNA-binding phage protein